MKLAQKKNKKNIKVKTSSFPLVVPEISGSGELTIPGELVDNIRYVITRVDKKDHLPVCLSIVSALRGEGVTMISQALAAVIANDLNARVCLVDLNWWWSSTSPLVSPENPGMAAVLSGDACLNDVITHTGWHNLFLIPAGKMARENRPVAARSRALEKAMEALNKHFDYLILDIPAILSTNDSIPLASLGSAACLVIHQGVTSMEDVHSALDEVAHMKLLGVILNKAKLAMPKPMYKLIGAR